MQKENLKSPLDLERQKQRELLAEAAQKRGEQWKPIFVKRLPDPETIGEYTMLGAHSFALVETRRRLVQDKILLIDGIYETPSALARDYLRLEYKRGPRGTSRQLEIVSGIPPVPSYAKPGRFIDGAYIDGKAMYWSIMQIAGWDVDYNPGLWLAPGRAPASFPFPDHKVARNCLVSAGRMMGIPTYNPRKLPGDPYETLTRGNELKNNQLPRLIADILNSIASLCIREGAVYVNNDGIITPSRNIADRCRQIFSDWGLIGRTKYEGEGEVKAGGTYSVGPHRTMNYDRNRDTPIKNVYPPPYQKWLQAEFSFLAAGAKL